MKGYKRSIYLNFDYKEVTEGVPQANRALRELNSEYKKQVAEINGTDDAMGKLTLGLQKAETAYKINVKGMWFAEVDTDTDSTITYKSAEKIAEAMTISINPQLSVGQHLATEQHFATREEAEEYRDTPKWEMIIAIVAEMLAIHTEVEHKKDKE